MSLRGRQEDMDRVDIACERGVYVPWAGSAECADLGLQASTRNTAHRIGLALGIDGESRFDYVHTELVQSLCNLQLILTGQSNIRRLLSISQGGVQYLDPLGHPCRREDLFIVFTHEPPRIGYLESGFRCLSRILTRSLCWHQNTLQKSFTAALRLE